MSQIDSLAILPQTAASVNSTALTAQNLFQCSVQMVCTGSAAGTLKVQASNDTRPGALPSQVTPTNWSDIPSATVTVTGAGTYLIPKIDICYQYIRLVYTNTGTGTIAANLKALGA